METESEPRPAAETSPSKPKGEHDQKGKERNEVVKNSKTNYGQGDKSKREAGRPEGHALKEHGEKMFSRTCSIS